MADQATIDEIVDYYVNLLIIQYNRKERARAHVRAYVEQVVSEGIALDVRDGFNLDTAVGVQLDIIGKYAGIDRFYEGTDYDGNFSFINYAEENAPPADRIGFSNYTDFVTKEGDWLLYSQVLSKTLRLNDADYRTIIKLKIIQNASNHSHKSIDSSMFEFFGTTVIPDSPGDMIMFYFVPADLGPIIDVALQKQVLPKPMGVGIGYVVRKTDDFFGFATFDGQSPLIEGFSNFSDYDTKEGEMLTNEKLLN